MKLTWDNRVDRRSNMTTILNPTEAILEEAIRGLDGATRTEVMLEGGDQFSVGGGGGQYVVSVFTVNERNLVAISPEAPNSDETVKLVAGGQKIAVPRKFVLSIELAVAAALYFLKTGRLDDRMTWEED